MHNPLNRSHAYTHLDGVAHTYQAHSPFTSLGASSINPPEKPPISCSASLTYPCEGLRHGSPSRSSPYGKLKLWNWMIDWAKLVWCGFPLVWGLGLRFAVRLHDADTLCFAFAYFLNTMNQWVTHYLCLPSWGGLSLICCSWFRLRFPTAKWGRRESSIEIRRISPPEILTSVAPLDLIHPLTCTGHSAPPREPEGLFHGSSHGRVVVVSCRGFVSLLVSAFVRCMSGFSCVLRSARCGLFFSCMNIWYAILLHLSLCLPREEIILGILLSIVLINLIPTC